MATAARIVDGWVKTGDIGRLDASGYLYDMVISGAVRSRVREGRSVSH